MKRFVALLALSLLAACSKSPRIALHYTLPDGLDPTTVVRVLTTVTVADGKAFTADQPYRSVDQGVAYEVSNDNGVETLTITHDSTLGYKFGKSFTFTLLAPVGGSPSLLISAKAYGTSATVDIAHTDQVSAKFTSSGTATLALVDDRCGSVTCGTGSTCCTGASGPTCVDTTTDSTNCGACGKACGTTGDSCADSTCRCNGASACTDGKTCTTGVGCIDTNTDPFNCGAAGKACNAGETCAGGTCACNGAAACAAGVACCGATGCAANATTGCACGATTCTPSQECCSATTCATTKNDDSNCGGCGVKCATSESCMGGHCLCGTGTNIAECAGTDTCCGDTGCKSLQDDPLNCGGCGKACGDGETCSAGQCRCGTSGACGNAKVCCGSGDAAGCVELSKNQANCGACGNVCDANSQCGTDANGVVGCVCKGTSQVCGVGQTCCAGSGCFDVSNTQGHCGSCTNTCAASQTCTMGSCVAGQNCNPACGTGFTCSGGSCLCGGKTCGSGESCCNNTCSDTTTDPKNCGSCGTVVAANQLCCASKPVAESSTNCGTCGTGCGLLSCTSCTNGYQCTGLFNPCK